MEIIQTTMKEALAVIRPVFLAKCESRVILFLILVFSIHNHFS